MMAPSEISDCTVILTFIRLEWGSVQMKLASMILSLFSPRNLRRQRASSSRDSNCATTQVVGGDSHLSQSLPILMLAGVHDDCKLSLTHMKCRFSLNAPGNICFQFDTVIAECCARYCPIHWSTAVSTENGCHALWSWCELKA